MIAIAVIVTQGYSLETKRRFYLRITCIVAITIIIAASVFFLLKK
jgi:succinate dehydrogenase hydrophobic anchor subunit